MNKKWAVIFLWLGVFLPTMLDAQVYLCGGEEAAAAHPEYIRRYQRVQRRNAAFRGQAEARTDSIYTIRTVVHIIYTEDEENLSNSLVEAQIAFLTRDFRALNADNDKVRDVFADRVGDARIEFTLAGIVRKKIQGPLAEGFGGKPRLEGIKDAATGGSSPWDVHSYYNIWICRLPKIQTLQGLQQILGYATIPDSLGHFPGYLPAQLTADFIDGVVLDYRTVSDGSERTDTVLQRTFTGRALTHETGHYLGLLHTFDGILDILANNACKLADGIEDTPPQSTATQKCTQPNTCTEIPDEPDMTENHMNYSDDACRLAFTQGQIGVMRGVLAKERSGLIQGVSGLVAAKDIRQMRIFPNPSADGLFNIQLPESSLVSVYNCFGLPVQYRRTNTQPTDLSLVPDGFYIFVCENEGQVLTQKVLLSRG